MALEAPPDPRKGLSPLGSCARSQISPCAAGLRVIGAMHLEAHVTDLPPSPDLSHLRKQAIRLLRDALAGKTTALQRFVEALPVVHGADLAASGGHALKLHDAQSAVARGMASSPGPSSNDTSSGNGSTGPNE